MSRISLKKDEVYSMALDKLEQGDFVRGIDWLYRSAPSGLDKDRRIDLAIAYFNIGQYVFALKEFFIAFPKCNDDYEILKYIIHCFIEIGQIDSALYYIKYGIDKGIFDDEDIEMEDFDFLPEPQIEILDKRDKSNEIQLAHRMIIAERLDFAEDILLSVTEDSYQYTDARNFLAMISIVTEKPEKALAYCNEVLSIEPNNIMALSQKFTALDMLGKTEERNDVIARLNEIHTGEVTDFAKMAVSFKMIGDDEATAKCFEKILLQLPYDRDYLICAAQAEYNCASYDRAKKLIVDALKLFPFDATVKYFAKEIADRNAEKKFDVLPIVPTTQTAIWFADLDNLIHLSFSAADKLIKSDEMLDLKIRWAFQNDFTAIQLPLVRLLMKSPKYAKLFGEYLLDPFGNLRTKQEIISVYMSCNTDFGEIVFSVNERIKVSRPHISENIRNHAFFPAYCKAFSFLIMTGEKFVTKLNNAFTAVIAAEKKLCEKPNFNAIAAVMINRLAGKFAAEDKCCDNMECDMTDFKVYKDLIYGK